MRIALVLGSGGARGYAHIGVIRELERRGHEVVIVSGTSMGALIGGIYAAGVMEKVADYAITMDTADVRRLTDVTLRAPGLIRLRRAMEKLHSFTGDVRIEDLPIPYIAVATDINHSREVWFRTGPLIKAIRASIAIPAVFTPVRSGNRLLVDGGLLNPLPTGPTRDVDADLCVGVSLFGRSATMLRNTPTNESSDCTSADDEPQAHGGVGTSLADSWVGRRVRDLFERDEEAEPALFDDLTSTSSVGLTDIGMRALDIMQGQIENARTAMSLPEVLIRVPMDACSILEFERAEELITLGQTLAAKEFDAAGL